MGETKGSGPGSGDGGRREPTAAEIEAAKKAVKRGIGRPVLTAPLYEAIRQGLIQRPEDFKGVARACGCAVSTVERAWEEGWKEFAWAPPLRECLVPDPVTVRATIQQRTMKEAAEYARERLAAEKEAREQAADVKSKEGNMLRLGRAAVIGTLGAMVKLQPALLALTERLDGQIRSGRITAKEGMALLREAGQTTRALAGAAQSLLEAERTFLGEPNVRVALMPMNREEALATISRAKDAQDRVARLMAGEADEDELDVTPVKLDGATPLPTGGKA